MTLAAQIAAGINARGGFQKANPQSLPMTPSQVAEQAATEQSVNEKWEDEVEINDLPQNVRWKITSKVRNFEIIFWDLSNFCLWCCIGCD